MVEVGLLHYIECTQISILKCTLVVKQDIRVVGENFVIKDMNFFLVTKHMYTHVKEGDVVSLIS